MVFVVCALHAIWGARLGAQSTSKKGVKAKDLIRGIDTTMQSAFNWTSPKNNPCLIPGTMKFKIANVNYLSKSDANKVRGATKARKMIAEFKNEIIVFTDGSANPNPGPCGSGI